MPHLSAHRRHASQVVYAIAIAMRQQIRATIFLLRIADMQSKSCMSLLALVAQSWIELAFPRAWKRIQNRAAESAVVVQVIIRGREAPASP